jgi:predicted amino acid racemase
VKESAEGFQELLQLEKARSEASSGFSLRGVSGEEPQSADQLEVVEEILV